MNEFQQWCATQTWTASVHEMLTKLWNKTEFYVVAYSHQGCHRTSNAVDRPMNRLCRLMYANRGLHGHQGSSELRLRGWALLLNFRPYAPRSNQPRTHNSPAHRLNGKRYHEHWLHNLMASTSLMGFRNRGCNYWVGVTQLSVFCRRAVGLPASRGSSRRHSTRH